MTQCQGVLGQQSASLDLPRRCPCEAPPPRGRAIHGVIAVTATHYNTINKKSEFLAVNFDNIQTDLFATYFVQAI